MRRASEAPPQGTQAPANAGQSNPAGGQGTPAGTQPGGNQPQSGNPQVDSSGQQNNNPQNSGTQGNASQNGPAALIFDPANLNQGVGSTFAVNVLLNGAQNVYSVPVQIAYDPKSLQVLNVSNGRFLSRDGQAVALVHRDDATTGTLQVTATRPPNSGGITGQGEVFTITFMAKAPGRSTLRITRDGLRDGAMQPIQASGGEATISVQ